LNPYGLRWSEVHVGDLLEVDFENNVISGTGIADRTAVSIRRPIHRRGFACVLHTHVIGIVISNITMKSEAAGKTSGRR
jgi:ribulose-5-phosphate 4-epimerase/fuculose-1-phosphate aldolase